MTFAVIRKTPQISWFMAGFVLLGVCATGIRAAAAPDFSEAEGILRQGVEKRAYPGCTVVVGTANQVLWSEAFGTLDYEHQQPVNKRTLYDLASVTKVTGTTSVCMQLVQRGKLVVTNPVSFYIPEFVQLASTAEDRERRRKVTVEHLLSHSAGLTAWKAYYRTYTNYHAMLQAVLKTPLERDPGKEVHYSDFGMLLAGEVAARAGGKPLPTLEQELVFVPLGMTNTLRNPPAAWKERIAPTELWPGSTQFVHGVVHDENARAGEGITGHAGLFSTAEDLGRLGAELLRAADGSSKWLAQPVFAEFIRPRGVGTASSRGLGWGLDMGPEQAISHNGFTGTYIRVDLRRKMYLVLLTNAVHPTRENNKLGRVRREAVNAILAAYDRGS